MTSFVLSFDVHRHNDLLIRRLSREPPKLAGSLRGTPAAATFPAGEGKKLFPSDTGGKTPPLRMNRFRHPRGGAVRIS